MSTSYGNETYNAGTFLLNAEVDFKKEMNWSIGNSGDSLRLASSSYWVDFPAESGLHLNKVNLVTKTQKAYDERGKAYTYKYYVFSFRITGRAQKTGTYTSSIRYTYNYALPKNNPRIVIITYYIKVNVKINPISITTLSLPEGMVEQAYSKQLEAIGTTPITWSVASGSLPPGLSLDPATGLISGTPLRTQF